MLEIKNKHDGTMTFVSFFFSIFKFPQNLHFTVIQKFLNDATSWKIKKRWKVGHKQC